MQKMENSEETVRESRNTAFSKKGKKKVKKGGMSVSGSEYIKRDTM